MRALALLAASGCVTAIQPRGGTLETTAPSFSAPAQTGTFSLGDTLKREHVVIVFYRGHW
jgi:hypothetical protein